MGLQLYRQIPVFRRVIEACSEVVADRLGWPLVEEFSGGRGGLDFHRHADRIQPAVTALQIALTEIFFEQGLRPAAVGGLSMGEPAACYAARILCLKDAMTIACCQASLTRQTLRPGRLAMVNLSVSGLKHHLERLRNEVTGTGSQPAPARHRFSIAAELSPTLTVISGEESQILQIVSGLEAHSIRCGMVPIHFGFHSPEVLPLLEPFRQLLAPFEVREGSIPVYSSVTGKVQEGAGFHRDYWWRIFRDRARFLSASKSMLRAGHRVFLEIGPHPTLLGPITETAVSMGCQIRTISSMQRDSDELGTLEASLDALKSLGSRMAAQPS